MSGRRVVEIDRGRNRNFRGTRAAGGFAALQQWLERRFTAQHVRKTLLKTVDFAGIQFQCAVQIGEVERIEHHAGRVREGIGLDNVHAPRGKHAGNG